MTTKTTERNINEEIANTIRSAYNVLPMDVREIVAAIARKDAYTAGHLMRVGILTSRICEYMNYGFEKSYKYFVAAVLHDTGKLVIQDKVLKKPAGLTDEEFAEMKSHAAFGMMILMLLGADDTTLAAAGLHHQHYDGGKRSYPFEIEGTDIPEVARVVAIADAVDAILSARVYDKARSSEDCYVQVFRGRGTQFDPKLSLCVLSHWKDFVGGLYPQV